MEDNMIMNEEVVETAQEVVEKTYEKRGFKIAAGVGVSLIVGFLTYKYVAKPVIANIKARLDNKKTTIDEDDISFNEGSDDFAYETDN